MINLLEFSTAKNSTQKAISKWTHSLKKFLQIPQQGKSSGKHLLSRREMTKQSGGAVTPKLSNTEVVSLLRRYTSRCYKKFSSYVCIDDIIMFLANFGKSFS